MTQEALPKGAFAKVTEAQWQAQVVAAIRKMYGDKAMIYHPWSSLHSESGYPDLTVLLPKNAGGYRLVVIELKSEKGKITEAQYDWLMGFEAAGIENILARPSDAQALWALLEPQ